MRRWAVSYIDFSSNELTTIIVEAANWYLALQQHPGCRTAELPSTSLEDAKEEAFNCDSMVDVVEIV